tara:strand:+ start:4287 stop:4667 length:381 start_codon:yes stop_codon:yes gene_type:complete
MAFSNYLAGEILDDVFSGNAFTPPGTFYLALYTSAPTASGGGTELSGNGYVRQTVAFTTTAQQSSNTAAVEFPTATADWGTIVAVGVFDSSSSGNLLAFGNLTASKNIVSGDVLRIPAGDLDINLA